MSEGDNNHQSALRVQLEQLQARINVHGARLWQLPFSYAAVVALGLDHDMETKIRALFYQAALFLGVCVLFAQWEAWRGYLRTRYFMNEVESDLKIRQTTFVVFGHALPYFLMTACVLFFCINGLCEAHVDKAMHKYCQPCCKP